MGDRRSNRKLGSHKVTITHTPPSKSKVRPPRDSNSRPRGHFFRKEKVSAIGLYRCLCIPMRMSARKGLSYGRLPDRSVCNNLT